jgi:hypothetical protein
VASRRWNRTGIANVESLVQLEMFARSRQESPHHACTYLPLQITTSMCYLYIHSHALGPELAPLRGIAHRRTTDMKDQTRIFSPHTRSNRESNKSSDGLNARLLLGKTGCAQCAHLFEYLDVFLFFYRKRMTNNVQHPQFWEREQVFLW